MAKKFAVIGDEDILWFEDAEEGGFIVTDPANPSVTTQAESLAGGFANAADCRKSLRTVREGQKKTRRK